MIIALKKEIRKEEREKLILAARFGLAALENREEPVQ